MTQITCPTCATQLSTIDRFCGICGTPSVLSAPPGAVPLPHPAHTYGYVLAPQFRYANFIVRFFAAVIDDLIAGAIVGTIAGLVSLLYFLFVMVGAASRDPNATVGTAFLGLGLFSFVFPLSVIAIGIYFIKMETGPWQATVGKRMMGLKVVNCQGGPISVGQSLGRFVVKWCFSDFFFMIGYIMAAFTERNQALHDYAAGTLVIQSR